MLPSFELKFIVALGTFKTFIFAAVSFSSYTSKNKPEFLVPSVISTFNIDSLVVPGSAVTTLLELLVATAFPPPKSTFLLKYTPVELVPVIVIGLFKSISDTP